MTELSANRAGVDHTFLELKSIQIAISNEYMIIKINATWVTNREGNRNLIGRNKEGKPKGY